MERRQFLRTLGGIVVAETVLGIGLEQMVSSAGRSPMGQSTGPGSGPALKENLDLPYDAIGESGEEEEAPETIWFYNMSIEGDAFFYVIDRSKSMQDARELDYAKNEVARNIGQYNEKVEFGVFFVDLGLLKYPPSGKPAKATPAQKSAAITYVKSVPGGAGSCPKKGLLAALDMAKLAEAKRKIIIYVGDGRGTCDGGDEAAYLRSTIDEVTEKNTGRYKINTIGVLHPDKTGENFMKELSAKNNGTYSVINR